MKEPVDHIIRPLLPWRSDGGITECGYDATKVKAITRAEFFQRKKDLGQQRCAMLTCMTCADTASRWESWENDPRQAMAREIHWERGEWRPRTDRGTRLHDELVAIAALVEAHREEFEGIIARDIARREEDAARREWIKKKESRKTPPKPTPPAGGL